MKFSEGEEVLARHPSTAEYIRGKVLNVRGNHYEVQFEPGKKHIVHQDDVKSSRPSRSTTRMSTRVTRKSPSRYSPSRRSPSRRPRTKSPMAASKKLPTRSTKLAKISLARVDWSNDKISDERTVSAKSTNDEDSPTDLMPLQSRLKEPVIRRSMRLLSNATTSTTVTTTTAFDIQHPVVLLTRNIDRAVSLPAERRSKLYDFLDGKERGHSVQRDQNLIKTFNHDESVQSESVEKDVNITEKREKEINLINQPQEWGGWLGTFVLLFLLPSVIILPQLVCKRSHFQFNKFELPRDVESYISLHAFYAYTGFLLFVALVSVMPIGRKVDGQQSKSGRLQYRINGFLCAVISIIILCMCVYCGIEITDFILDNFVQLSVSGWLLGTVIAIFAYIKAGRASIVNLNIHAATNSVIYNFWQGREMNPRIGPLDIKLILWRTSLIGMLVTDLAIICKAIEEVQSLNTEHLNTAVFLATSLQTFCVFDMLIFESSILTSFEIMYEGTGYLLCVAHLLYPFLPTITTRYMLYQKPHFSYFFVFFLLCFIIGYILFRVSNSQKDEFRKSPYSPALAYLDTIPTIRGKKLIASGLWGFVRHPNYLGDVIMQWSIACISLSTDLFPYYAAICTTLALIYRAIRDNKRCKSRYGLAWEQYCSRVKYMILYRVF